jgi:hypothetical protein
LPSPDNPALIPDKQKTVCSLVAASASLRQLVAHVIGFVEPCLGPIAARLILILVYAAAGKCAFEHTRPADSATALGTNPY